MRLSGINYRKAYKSAIYIYLSSVEADEKVIRLKSYLISHMYCCLTYVLGWAEV